MSLSPHTTHTLCLLSIALLTGTIGLLTGWFVIAPQYTPDQHTIVTGTSDTTTPEVDTTTLPVPPPVAACRDKVAGDACLYSSGDFSVTGTCKAAGGAVVCFGG